MGLTIQGCYGAARRSYAWSECELCHGPAACQDVRASMSSVNAQGISGLEQLNLYDSADRIILCAPLPAQARQSSPNRGLVVVEGRFDWPTLRKALLGQGARVRTFAGKEILVARQSSGMDGVLALAEPGILLAEDLKSVEAALAGATMPETSSLYRRATSLAVLLDKVQIAATPSEVRMSLNLDEAELDQSFRSLRAALPGGMQPVQVRPVYRGGKNITWPSVEAGGATPTPAVAEAQKPPERQVIRLYGAEGGTREIPMENR